MLPIEIKRVKKDFLDSFIKEEHYLHRASTIRPSICYVFYSNGQIVALQEWTAVWKMILLRFPFLQHLELIDNSRFLIRKNREKRKGILLESFSLPEIYNLGTRTLSLGIRELKKDWRKETGIKPKLLITYVDCNRGYDGTVYKAASWKEIRMSTDSIYSKGRGVSLTSSKKTFMFILRRNIFCKEFSEFSKGFLRDNWEKMNKQAQYNYMPSSIRKERYFSKENKRKKGLFLLEE